MAGKVAPQRAPHVPAHSFDKVLELDTKMLASNAAAAEKKTRSTIFQLLDGFKMENTQKMLLNLGDAPDLLIQTFHPDPPSKQNPHKALFKSHDQARDVRAAEATRMPPSRMAGTASPVPVTKQQPTQQPEAPKSPATLSVRSFPHESENIVRPRSAPIENPLVDRSMSPSLQASPPGILRQSSERCVTRVFEPVVSMSPYRMAVPSSERMVTRIVDPQAMQYYRRESPQRYAQNPSVDYHPTSATYDLSWSEADTGRPYGTWGSSNAGSIPRSNVVWSNNVGPDTFSTSWSPMPWPDDSSSNPLAGSPRYSLGQPRPQQQLPPQHSSSPLTAAPLRQAAPGTVRMSPSPSFDNKDSPKQKASDMSRDDRISLYAAQRRQPTPVAPAAAPAAPAAAAVAAAPAVRVSPDPLTSPQRNSADSDRSGSLPGDNNIAYV